MQSEIHIVSIIQLLLLKVRLNMKYGNKDPRTSSRCAIWKSSGRWWLASSMFRSRHTPMANTADFLMFRVGSIQISILIFVFKRVIVFAF